MYAELFDYGFTRFCEDAANDAGEFAHLAGIADKMVKWREAREVQLR